MNAALVTRLSARPPDASNESPAPLAGGNRAEFPKTSTTQSHSRPHAARRAATHAIAVSPHMRADGTKHPNAFEARLAGAVLCVSETPLLDGARALLARSIAQPDDTIAMRHAGSHVDALRARVGVAAGLAIEDRPSGNPGLLLGKYRQRCTGRPSIAQTPSRLPGQPVAGKSHPWGRRAASPRVVPRKQERNGPAVARDGGQR